MAQMESIGDIIMKILAGSNLEQGIKKGETLDIWEDVVGKEIARHAEAIHVEQGILFVRVNDSNWRSELSLMSEQIIEKINDHFEEKRIHRIHLV